jgi:hypothetical protein
MKEVHRKMKNKNLSIILLLILPLFVFSFAITSVSASPPEKDESFVCPVLVGNAGDNPNSPWKNPDHPLYGPDKFVMPPGGFYTILGPRIVVPIHATNQDGDGSPTPDDFASPGGEDYSPLWWDPAP